jgi:hypothetical protein
MDQTEEKLNNLSYLDFAKLPISIACSLIAEKAVKCSLKHVVIMNKITFLVLLLSFSCSKKKGEKVMEYFENGNLKAEYVIEDSLKNGYAKTYFGNGVVYYEGEYQNDKRLGWHVLYYESGKIRQKYYYVIEGGKENAIRRLYFNQQGKQTSEITFARKRLEIAKLNDGELSVGDTLNLRVKILNSKYSEVEGMMGHFDANLNTTAEIDDPVFLRGRNHQVLFRIVMTEVGAVEITGLVRDYEERLLSDSTTFIVGEDSFFKYSTVIGQRIRL